jgi:hypothetical protein
MRNKSKRFFSLIELMFVLIIIAVASTAIGIKITKSITDHEYKRATDHILEKLMFAKKLALVNQCDVYLNLIQEKDKLALEIGYSGESSSSGKMKYRHAFSKVKFNFETENNGTLDKSVSFVFTSTGDYHPRGVLCLFSSNKSKNSEPIKIDFKDFFLREIIYK